MLKSVPKDQRNTPQEFKQKLIILGVGAGILILILSMSKESQEKFGENMYWHGVYKP